MGADRGPAAGGSPEVGSAVAPGSSYPAELASWAPVWGDDRRLPPRSHRRLVGRVIVWAKRLLRPLFEAPVAELWERQREFNLALLRDLAPLPEALAAAAKEVDLLGTSLRAQLSAHEAALVERGAWHRAKDERLVQHESKFEVVDDLIRALEGKVGHLEKQGTAGLRDVMRHNDALFALVDQKLDRYHRAADELRAVLSAALAAAAVSTPATLRKREGADAAEAETAHQLLNAALAESAYVELERQHRGTEEEIRARIEVYLPRLVGKRDVIDLGCGRGEALALFAAHGLAARGIDASTRMVEICRAKGLEATCGDLYEALAAQPVASADAIVCLHVVEHLDSCRLGELARLAWRTLRPGGLFIVETPNALSLVAAASRFWVDPTHRRPVHPESLRSACDEAGFSVIETQWLRPFPPSQRLPEIDRHLLVEAEAGLADQVNRIRDVVDDILHGDQDVAVIAVKR